MGDYVLSCGSTADLSAEYMKTRDISFICYPYFLDSVPHLDDLGASLSHADFYRALRSGAESSTSQINQMEYTAYFASFLKQGKDVLHIAFSSGLSGACQSAMLAKETLEKQYPERKIFVVDSLAASSGYGLLMATLADLRDSGMSVEELRDWAVENRLRVHHWFFSTDLTSYVKGGRISRAAAIIGNILHICPLMNVDAGGHLVPREKIRTKRKAIARALEMMQTYADDGAAYSGKCFISHSDCEADARLLAARIEEAFPALSGRIRLFSIGTTIGSHTGPDTVALFFWGDARKDSCSSKC